MPFIVDDILITWLIVPFAARLRDRYLDQLANVADKGLQKLLHGVDEALQAPPEAQQHLLESATSALADDVEESPAAEAQLITVATQSIVAAIDDEEQFLEAMADFLAFVFHMIEKDRRPVVLSGFLSGADDDCVIDVRTRKYGEMFTAPPRAVPPVV